MFTIRQIIQSLKVSPHQTQIVGAPMITDKILLQTLTNAKFESLNKKKSSPIVSELLAACSCSLTINILNQNWNIQTKFTKYMRSALSSSLSKRCILCWRKNSVHPVRACLAVGVGSGTFHFILPTIPKCFHLLVGGRRHTIGITYILNWIPTYLPTNSPTNQLTNFTQRSPSYATSLV